MPVKTVAPVVVRPDKASKVESVKEFVSSGAKYIGMAPNNPRPI